MNAGTLGLAAVWLTVGLSLLAAATGKRRWLGAVSAAATLAVAVLTAALLTADFSLAYVAETTSLATPWPYRLAALWGGMDGSMLFYTAATAVAALVGLRRRHEVRMGAAAVVFLALLTLFYANPFDVLDLPPVDGQGLLAILQHPAMIYHPPLLYAGLVVLVVPFAKTVQMVADGNRSAWSEETRVWLYASWILLTVGMAAGANWAYVELGWGGFWAWDPVENTALMPWLATTALLHVRQVEAAVGRWRRWNVFLTAFPFALSVMGVYLTRSGVTGSIHSFAENPEVGRLLLIAALSVTVVSTVVSWRSPQGDTWSSLRLDKTTWLASGAVLLGTTLVFVTIGTAYPAVASLFFDEAVAVDSGFFVVTVLPVAVAIGAGVGLSLDSRRWKVFTAVTVGVALVVGLLWHLGPGLALLSVAAGSLATLAARLATGEWSSRRLASMLAHLGIATLLVAVAASSYGDSLETTMTPGDSVEVGGHRVALAEIDTGESDRYLFVRSAFDVDGSEMTPEIRAYEDQPVPVSEPALRSTLTDDVIVATSLLFPDGETVAVSVFVRPLVWWVWPSAAMVALAGLVSLFGTAEGVAKPRRSARGERRPGGTTSRSAAR